MHQPTQMYVRMHLVRVNYGERKYNIAMSGNVTNYADAVHFFFNSFVCVECGVVNFSNAFKTFFQLSTVITL